MKFTWAILLFPVMYSCNSTEHDTDEQYKDICLFEMDILVPDEPVKRAIEETVSRYISEHPLDFKNNPLYYKDSLCIHVFVNRAEWRLEVNDDPKSIKIITTDTECFFVTISDGLSLERDFCWWHESEEDRVLLRKINSKLNTGTYILTCIDCDEPIKNSISDYGYWDSGIIGSQIDFNVYLKNGKGQIGDRSLLPKMSRTTF